jgi:DnaJ-related protein SCJ1
LTQFNIDVRRICHHCDGSGAHSPKDIVECPHCQGQGIVIVRQQIAPGMFTQMQQHCPHCQGRGRMTKRLCPVCSGQRVVQTTNTLSLSIDRGLPEDSEILFEGEADEAPDYEPGDVVVRVKSRAEEGGFTRKGPHLYYKQAIGVDEALLGFERKVKGLDGHWLALRREGTTQPGFIQVIKEEGMRASDPLRVGLTDLAVAHYHLSGFGNLYVEYSVVLPASLDKSTQSSVSFSSVTFQG